MEDAVMDIRTKTVIASFRALLAFLALAAWTSTTHA